LGWPGEQREVWAGPAWPRLAGTLPGVEAEILYALRRAGVSGRVVRVAADTNGFLTVAALTVTHPAHSSVDELQTSVGRLLRALFEEVPALDEVDVTAVARHRPDPAGLPDVTFTAAASRPEVLRAPGNLPPAQLVRGLPRVWVHPLFDRPAERLQEILRTPPPVPDPSPDPLRTLLDHLQEVPDRLRGHLLGQRVGGKLYRGSPRRRAVALTFDDGPTPLYTSLLLDTLNRLRLHATFFLVGRRVEQYPYFASAVVQAGHELGNHSYAHRSLVGLPPDRVRGDLQRAQRVLLRATGRTPKLFRPPGGRYDRTVVEVASDLGMLTVLWTDDPGDYEGLGIRRLQTRLLSRVYSGGILLLHQGVPDTVRVLPAAWQVLQRHGYAVTTVTGLFAAAEGPWEPSSPPRR
jgi:peptidoglycan/xylan/chitin deacetylase (PgdA/CDA1 family)